MSRIKLRSLLPLIKEGYHEPHSAEVWLMDVYALYALWWAIGSGKSQYAAGAGKSVDSYAPKHVNNLRVKVIDDMFQSALYGFSKSMYIALTHACYDELENVVDDSLIPPRDLASWLKHNAPEELRKEFKFLPATNLNPGEFRLGAFEGFFSRVGWQNIIKIFNAPFWEKYAEMYGGKAWVKICQATINLIDQIKHGSEKDLMHALDVIIDMHHNTGSILNQNKVGKMAISQKVLDIRAHLRSVDSFLPYVSQPVANLINSSKNHLEESILTEGLLLSQKSLQIDSL
jgi:hypothetical protein